MGKEETTVFWLKFLAVEIDISVLKTRRQESIVPDRYVMLLKLKKKKKKHEQGNLSLLVLCHLNKMILINLKLE